MMAARAATAALLVLVLTSTITLSLSLDIEMGQTFEEAIESLDLSTEQAQTILDYVGKSVAERDTETHTIRRAVPLFSMELQKYLSGQVSSDAMDEDTSYVIQNMLQLNRPEPHLHPVSTAKRSWRRVVGLEGQWEAPEENVGIYNGIWGYTAPNGAEYALACNSLGLNILDVSRPFRITRLQFIEMPGGNPWRDVATHFDVESGKTFAYVAGQGGNDGAKPDLWVIDLSFLPNEIPQNEGYKILEGYQNDGHTLNVDRGFLFLNTANANRGVKILDLLDDPWNPTFIAQKIGGEGHDSFYKEGVIVNGTPRNVLIVSDGFKSRTRFIDITDLRSIYASESFVTINATSALWVGDTGVETGTYAHSSAVSEDGSYVYLFDEYNVNDISIFDIREATNPIRIGDFQWSGENWRNSIVHNGRVKGNNLHVAYYAAGYRVFDISNPVQPVEVGSYQTSCSLRTCNQNEYLSYRGAWNVYTDLASGNVLVSDTVSGLYVFSMKM